mmetsp:Transcript_57774/g.122915  ORF Transcript_57774/g.122915 Transcript_57774/m.122915 type:complete len:217 (+) Transcript_57774:591-1241(+)
MQRRVQLVLLLFVDLHRLYLLGGGLLLCLLFLLPGLFLKFLLRGFLNRFEPRCERLDGLLFGEGHRCYPEVGFPNHFERWSSQHEGELSNLAARHERLSLGPKKCRLHPFGHGDENEFAACKLLGPLVGHQLSNFFLQACFSVSSKVRTCTLDLLATVCSRLGAARLCSDGVAVDGLVHDSFLPLEDCTCKVSTPQCTNCPMRFPHLQHRSQPLVQ